jgi:hypothetical protein
MWYYMPADSNLHDLHNAATQVKVASDEIFRKTHDRRGRSGQTCSEHGELRNMYKCLVGKPKMKISVDIKTQMEK